MQFTFQFYYVDTHLCCSCAPHSSHFDHVTIFTINKAGTSPNHTQHIDEIPDDLKKLYKTVWEISQKTLINMAADRGAYIDQSQSFNVHMAETNFGKLTSMHFYGWRKVCSCQHTVLGTHFGMF